MNAQNRRVWQDHIMLPDGHRLFPVKPEVEVAGHPLIAIADESGTYPEDTNDGIMWLDFERPLSMRDSKGLCTIPLLNPHSHPSRTITDPQTTMFLSDMYDWDIDVNEVLFRAVKRDEP